MNEMIKTKYMEVVVTMKTIWYVISLQIIKPRVCSSFICQKWQGPSSHPGVGVGLCGYKDGWSGQFVPGKFSGSMDREWWLLFGICLCCFSSPLCTVQLLLSCWLCRFLHPCEQMLATSLCLMQSAPKVQCWCQRPSMRLLVCLCSTFSGLLGSTSLVAVCHRTVFREPMVWHVNYMPCPAKLWLHQDGVDAGHASMSEDLSIWDLVLPLDAKEFSEASGVEVVQLPCMVLVDCPWFASIEEGGENYGLVNLDLCL